MPGRMKAWQPGKRSVPSREGEREPGRAASIPSSSCPPWELAKGKTGPRPLQIPPSAYVVSAITLTARRKFGRDVNQPSRGRYFPSSPRWDTHHPPPGPLLSPHPALTRGSPWPCPSVGSFNNPISPSFPAAPSRAFSLALFITLLCIPLNSNNTNRGSAAIVASKMFTPGSL